MSRNFDHRFEIACPIYDESLKSEIMDILKIQIADNVKARIVNTDPINAYVDGGNDIKIRSQFDIYNYLKKKS